MWFSLNHRFAFGQRTSHNLVSIGFAMLIFGASAAIAQPPVGPDPRPKVISPDDLSKAIGGPTLVTVKGTEARPEKLFASLAEQAGLHLDQYLSMDLLKKKPAISANINAEPVMSALKKLAACWTCTSCSPFPANSTRVRPG